MADQAELKAATEAAVANFKLERVLNQGTSSLANKETDESH